MSERRPAPTVGQVVLGKRLQELREAAGLKREEAAKVLRVASATVRRMEMAEVALPPSGTVWSWTVQRIRPKPPYRGPEEFEPFAVAYVDVGPVLVESRLAGRPVDDWRIGEPVDLVVDEADANADGPVFVFVGGAA